ncbi:hypothetical protein KR222_008906 [Zaprionus bogoriensis]|nr:hypothetical protein KR222_008906 [Zaprionus bogoriensis]
MRRLFQLMICALVGLAAAAVPRHSSAASGDDVHAETLLRKDDVRPDGFETVLDTSNHITEKRVGDEHGNIHGDFEWISPEGEHVKVSYVADEYGYQPKSDLLPTPPPIPVEIERALAWIAAHPQAPEYHH